jgi:hypothetical protein
MKWKCEVEYRGRRYELVENACLGCAECAFSGSKQKCKIPTGFPTCTPEVCLGKDDIGRVETRKDTSRIWREVAQ